MILKFIVSSVLFPVFSFLVWALMAKIQGSCPMHGLSFVDMEKMKYLPLLILWNGVFFTAWFKWISSKYSIKAWQFGIVSFWLTRYFHELYMYLDVKDYSVRLLIFGMIHGLISTVLWAVAAGKILGTSNTGK